MSITNSLINDIQLIIYCNTVRYTNQICKKITDLNPFIASEQLISFCTKLTKLQYHFYLPFFFISLDNQPTLYTGKFVNYIFRN